MEKSIQEIIEEIKNKNRTLFILCGLPYSGKTYYAKKIIENVSIEYVSIDDIFYKLGFDWSLNKLPDEKSWKEIFDTSYEKIKQALGNSLNVLYDSTNHTKISRDKLREIAKEMNADSNVIFIDIPEDVIYERWENNKNNPTRHIVDKKLVDMTIGAFEKPEDYELVFIMRE